MRSLCSEMYDSSHGVDTTIALLLLLITAVAGQQQAFRETPTDLEVIVGQTARLRCHVNNIQGPLQWTRDGLMLGYIRSIPGFPNYQMVGSEGLGEYDLMVSDVTLEDDAEYQCQVGPAENNPPLLAKAYLSVLVPPDAPQISGHANGSTVEVPHHQKVLNLTCEAKHGKPAAVLTWKRNGEIIENAGVYYSITQLEGDKRQDAQSILSFEPTGEDNNAYFTCEAKNAALLKSISTTIQLSVMHPPNKPVITGYKTGDVVKTGDTVLLTCASQGGNPLAQVYWFKNDVGKDFSYETGNKVAENKMNFTVAPDDNDAIYRCEASNRVTSVPLSDQVKFTVQFAPTSVKISGHQHAKAGDTITLSCETAISNPPATITWITRGHQLPAQPSEVKPSPKGGFITTSNISVTLTDRENDVVYQCHAINEALGTTTMDTVSLTVMYPPEKPTIAGYTEGREVTAGNIISMTCTSVGGNPPATLTWWKGSTQLESVTRKTGNIVSTQVSFILRPDDNQASYRCNATNPATIEPLLTSTTLTVNFPPSSLAITTRPKNPKAGQRLTITCRSATSNPTSVLSWWKDGREIPGLDGEVEAAEFGGKASISRLELTPTADDDGQIYACRATNPLLERAVSDAVTLNIRYKPAFPSDVPNRLDILEGNSAVLNLTARGRPSDVTYTWTKDGEKLRLTRSRRAISLPHWIVDGGVLNITNISRKDSGRYLCTAENEEGQTVFVLDINVQFPGEVSRISEPLMVDTDATAMFECEANANPMKDNMVSWTRDGYDMSRTSESYEGGTSKLSIHNVTKSDTGLFVCSVNNGLGTPATATAQLIVKYPPEMDDPNNVGKAAARIGTTGKILCKASGAPAIAFTWHKGGEALDLKGIKYKEETKKINIIRYESTLSVFNVTKSDYGRYNCIAKNDLGIGSKFITLDGTSKPDPPFNLRFINSTHNSITLSWTPGFNGGLFMWYQVRYSQIDDEAVKYEDVNPKGAFIYKVGGLDIATEYKMTVRAINDLGMSEFAEDYIVGRTAAVAPLSEGYAGDDVPLIIILTVSIIGMVLLGLNVLLILFFIRKRRRKLEKDASESASNANTVEMFSAPTITEDSKSYTTYDRHSLDDFHDGLYRPYDESTLSKLEATFQDEDEMRFLMPPGYMPPDYNMAMKGGLYAPPPRLPQDMNHSPGVDKQRSFLVNQGSRDPIYMDDKAVRDQGWDPRKDPYSTGSLRRPRSDIDDDGEEYAEQLRSLQRAGAGTLDRDPRRPHDIPPKVTVSENGPLLGQEQKHKPRPNKARPMTPVGGYPSVSQPSRAAPPPPPMRSTSQGAIDNPAIIPPLPTRNYGPEEVTQRYPPPPGPKGRV